MDSTHLLANQHLPWFIKAPGQTDTLMVAMGVFVVLAVVGIGVFYFKLHALPEQMAHRGQKIQYEIVAVLALLALFTHNHFFWVAALLLAFVPLPDFGSPLISMAQSLQRIADRLPPPEADARADAPAEQIQVRSSDDFRTEAALVRDESNIVAVPSTERPKD